MIRRTCVAVAGAIALTLMPAVPKSMAQEMSAPVQEILEQLELTPEQRSQVDSIQELAKAQIKEILTPEQLDRLAEITAAGEADTSALRSLNLSAEQNKQLGEVQAIVAQRLFTVLDEQQQKKLVEALSNRVQE